MRPPPRPTPFPYTTLFRSPPGAIPADADLGARRDEVGRDAPARHLGGSRSFERPPLHAARGGDVRSEEHTSELQSRRDLVCRLLLEKKKTRLTIAQTAHIQ